MSNMNAFRRLLSSTSEQQSARLNALIALTKVSPAQLVAMTEGLEWQRW